MDLLKQDLEVLAAERLKDQELPSAEQLIALRDGRLEEQLADRLHLQMAADPELAEVYLSLCRAADDAESGEVSEEQIDRGLQALMDRVDGKESGDVLPFAGRGRRMVWAGWAAVAATLLLVFGLRTQQPDGAYWPVDVPSDSSRGAKRIELPADFVGLELILNAELLRSLSLEGTSVDLRLETVQGDVLVERSGVSTADPPIRLKAHRRELVDGRTYVLKIRESGGASWLKGLTFKVTFIAPPTPDP